MCGICGIIKNTKSDLKNNIERMNRSLAHRGPDDAGIFIDNKIALGASRLAIIDLTQKGHMPMTSQNSRYVIVYNGEIFNYLELKKLPVFYGFSFKSNSDTELVLELYSRIGPKMLNLLNGFFAISIWDKFENKLFIARDRMGIKPLYYYYNNEFFIFASEPKAIFTTGISTQMNENKWSELLLFRFVAGEETIYKSIKNLLPGYYLIFQKNKLKKYQWWNLENKITLFNKHIPYNSTEWFRETFDDAVKIRLMADVPIGVMLSGGLDSTSILASATTQTNKKISAFSVVFNDKSINEGNLAKEVATKYGAKYFPVSIKNRDIMSLSRQASFYLDEPMAHGNDPYIFGLAKFAKKNVSVLLSGEGSDEILGGYLRYRPLLLPKIIKILPMIVNIFRNNHDKYSKLNRYLKLNNINDITFYNAADTYPYEIEKLNFKVINQNYRKNVFSNLQNLYPNDYWRQAMILDQHTFLTSLLNRNDKLTMAAGIESRTPFLDYRLVETLSVLSSYQLKSWINNKNLLRKSVGSRLPNSILANRKRGFEVPWKLIFRKDSEFRNLIINLIKTDPFKNSDLALDKIKILTNNFLKGDDSNAMLIRQLVYIAIWFDVCIKNKKI